jgi:hypothetical protein
LFIMVFTAEILYDNSGNGAISGYLLKYN